MVITTENTNTEQISLLLTSTSYIVLENDDHRNVNYAKLCDTCISLYIMPLKST